MSENNGFFKSNPSLDHNQSVPIQGSLDPLEQESLDPYVEPKKEPVAEEAKENPSAAPYGNASYCGGAPQQGRAASYSDSFMQGGDHVRPSRSGVMSSEPNVPPAAPPPPADKKKKTLIVAVVAAALVLVACIGIFGFVLFQDRQDDARDQAAAQEVVAMIAAIGDVSLGSNDAIINARSHYDALTAAQKEYVTNYATLTASEQKYQQMKAEADAEAAAEAQREAEEKARKEAAKSTLVIPAYDSYYGEYMVTADSGLVLRYGPSKDYNKIVTMPYGTWVSVYAWSGEWAYVSYNGKQGWCNGQYLY